MLAHPYRLKKDEDFQKVKKEGKVFQSDNFAISYLKRDDKESSRFGFVVSTKISKKASIRNKIKRALREAVRHDIAYIKKGYDVAFLAKKPSTRAYTRDLMKEVKSALKKANLLK